MRNILKTHETLLPIYDDAVCIWIITIVLHPFPVPIASSSSVLPCLLLFLFPSSTLKFLLIMLLYSMSMVVNCSTALTTLWWVKNNRPIRQRVASNIPMKSCHIYMYDCTPYSPLLYSEIAFPPPPLIDISDILCEILYSSNFSLFLSTHICLNSVV